MNRILILTTPSKEVGQVEVEVEVDELTRRIMPVQDKPLADSVLLLTRWWRRATRASIEHMFVFAGPVDNPVDGIADLWTDRQFLWMAVWTSLAEPSMQNRNFCSTVSSPVKAISIGPAPFARDLVSRRVAHVPEASRCTAFEHMSDGARGRSTVRSVITGGVGYLPAPIRPGRRGVGSRAQPKM